MADRVNKAQRSHNMSLIRKFGNESTEMRMARLFREHGLKGWRRHVRLPGTPDFIFPRSRVAVFVDGCFWHHCPRCVWTPSSNIEYWQSKFAMNQARDRKANRALRRAGWNVVRIWEHSLARPRTVISRIQRLLAENERTRQRESSFARSSADDL